MPQEVLAPYSAHGVTFGFGCGANNSVSLDRDGSCSLRGEGAPRPCVLCKGGFPQRRCESAACIALEVRAHPSVSLARPMRSLWRFGIKVAECLQKSWPRFSPKAPESESAESENACGTRWRAGCGVEWHGHKDCRHSSL